MTRNLFTEAVKVLNGRFYNLPMHLQRISDTSRNFWGNPAPISLSDEDIPSEYRTGLVKCRIVYADSILSIEYAHYKFRDIRKLKPVSDNSIDYSFKYADRTAIDALLALKGDCDDILIVKNGCITDTSFSNVVFESSSGLYTPSSCLLPGTKRRLLLSQGTIREKEIRIEDVKDYTKLYIINTMIDLEDNIAIDTSCLI